MTSGLMRGEGNTDQLAARMGVARRRSIARWEVPIPEKNNLYLVFMLLMCAVSVHLQHGVNTYPNPNLHGTPKFLNSGYISVAVPSSVGHGLNSSKGWIGLGWARFW